MLNNIFTVKSLICCLCYYNSTEKLDSRLPKKRGGIQFLSISRQLHHWSSFIFSIASQHDLGIGH